MTKPSNSIVEAKAHQPPPEDIKKKDKTPLYSSSSLLPKKVLAEGANNTSAINSTKCSTQPGTKANCAATSSPLFSHIQMEHMVAGMTGGVVSTVLLHPLDLVKIRFAVNDGMTSRPKYDGLTHAFKSIWKDEGVRGLYRGVTPNVWGAGSAWGLYFLFYNSLKSWWQGGDSKTNLGPTRHMIIATEAGFLTLVFTNPIWVVKTRLCLQYGTPAAAAAAAGPVVPGAPVSAQYYSGMADALMKVYRTEGIRGLYKGMVPGMFGVSHGAIQFMVYEEMKTWYNKRRKMPIDAKLGTSEYLGFAAVSKLIAAATTYPYQVVRARLQDQHRTYEGVMDVLRQTWRYEGMIGFYKGLSPYLLHVTPNICLVFIIYETLTNSGRR